MRRLGLLLLLLPIVACSDEPATDGSRYERPGSEPVIGGSVQDTTEKGGVGDPSAPEPPSEVPTVPGDSTPAPPETGVLGVVGSACDSVTDCGVDPAVCLSLPGGYCAVEDCANGGNECPEGSQCFAFDNDSSYCIETCSTSEECREEEGYVCDEDGTCWPGPDAPTTGGGTSPVGGPCEADSDCADAGAICYPYMIDDSTTGFVNGYCLINSCTPDSCPAGSSCAEIYADGGTSCVADCDSTADCRSDEGYTCFSPGLCFPGCGVESSCPENYECGESGLCDPTCTDATCGPDLVCAPSGLCEEPPCTVGSCPSGLTCAASGKCVPDLEGGPGPGPGPTCSNLPPKSCTGTQAYCGELIPFEPVEGPGYVNYPLNGESWSNQYRSYARRDLVMLVQWASAYVDCKAPAWTGGNGYPLGMGDMSEVDGAIPGTSDGSPGHPAGTHEEGYDIDIAYFQNEQTGQPNNYLRAICDHVEGGEDQYHCISEPYMLDVWRSALFIGALFSSNRTRVIGVDGKVGVLVSEALETLCGQGWVPEAGCNAANQSLAYEVVNEGMGWYHFHHHHMHLSLWTLESNPSGMQAPKECLDAPCSDMSSEMDFMREAGRPGLVRSQNTSEKRPMTPWMDTPEMP